MTSWLGLLPAIFVAIALSTIPGIPLAWALRLRGLTFLAGSIAGSFVVIAVSSIVAPVVGLNWSFLPVFAVMAGVTALLLATRMIIRKRSDRERFFSSWREVLLYGGTFIIAFLVICWTLFRGMMHPENIAQIYDSVFHLNAVAFIADSGSASPFDMTMTTSEGTSSFYPTVWHASVSLIVQLTGTGISAATNALSIAVSAWVWPVAILFFARPFFVSRPVHVIAGGLLAGSFATFPYSFLYWGTLYPNLLSYALAPIALGFLHLALRYRHRHNDVPLAALWIGFGGAMGAAVLAHPNALFSIIALASPLLIVTIWDIVRNVQSRKSQILRISLVVLAFIVCGVLWLLVTTGDSSRVYDASILGAAVTIAGTAPFFDVNAWFLTLLILIGGILFLMARRHRWIIGSYLIVVVLYVIVTASDGPVRDLFTVAWYNDAYRIAALLPLVAMPLAARTGAEFLDLIQHGTAPLFQKRVPSTALSLISTVATVSGLVMLLLAARGPALEAVTNRLQDVFKFDDQSELLTPNELALFERLPSNVPDDALIAGNPRNGSALAYMVSGSEVLFPHLQGNFSDDAITLAREFGQDRPLTCELVNDLGVTHLFGSAGHIYIGASEDFAGFDNLDESTLLTRVDAEGDAALYEVTGC